MMWRKACVATVQFSSTQNGFYVLGKARIRSTQSLRRFPDVGFETVPSDWRWPSLVLSSKIVECSSFHASLLQATDGVMSLALCSLVVSQAPQHFRSPETRGSVTDVTYVSHFFTPRQSGTDVTKDMCCHWKTCCSCCLTKDLFCHCCDGGNVSGVTKDICYHRCYERQALSQCKEKGIWFNWYFEGHVLSLMWWGDRYCRWCEEKGICSHWCVEGHVLSLIVMRTHVLSLMWWRDRYCQWCDEKTYVLSLMWGEDLLSLVWRKRHVFTDVSKDMCCHWCVEEHV